MSNRWGQEPKVYFFPLKDNMVNCIVEDKFGNIMYGKTLK